MTTVPRGPTLGTNWIVTRAWGCLSRRNFLWQNTASAKKQCLRLYRITRQETSSEPLENRRQCTDRMCDARPATYMCCGLRDTAGRIMHGWHTGRRTNGRAASCLWRPGVRTLCALDRRSGVHELALKTCSILCNWKKQLPTRKGARATVGGWDDLQLVQGDPGIFILQGWP